MNISITTPEISLLRNHVEQKSGIQPQLPTDFMLLASEVSSCGERLSQSTLERAWQYSTRSPRHVSLHTLNVLSRYVGADDWRHFCTNVAPGVAKESCSFATCGIDVAHLAPNTRLRLCWLPNRTIIIEYLGDCLFRVEKSENSGVAPGDTFSCRNIQQGQPLYLDSFRRSGATNEDSPGRYVIGRNSGITNVEILD